MRQISPSEVVVREGWPHLGWGRHRSVFQLPSGSVIKFPLNSEGEVANLWEALVWKFRHRKNEMPLFIQEYVGEVEPARCRLIPNTRILVMEFVTQIRFDALPSWAYRKQDGAQSGQNNAGHIVSFDFADFRGKETSEALAALEYLQNLR